MTETDHTEKERTIEEEEYADEFAIAYAAEDYYPHGGCGCATLLAAMVMLFLTVLFVAAS